MISLWCWSGKEIKQIGTAVNAVCQGNLSTCHRLASPGLVDVNCSSSEMSVTSINMKAHSRSWLFSTMCQIIWCIQNWHAQQSALFTHTGATFCRHQLQTANEGSNLFRHSETNQSSQQAGHCMRQGVRGGTAEPQLGIPTEVLWFFTPFRDIRSHHITFLTKIIALTLYIQFIQYLWMNTMSMQPLAPAWVSATPLWDHQTFHINCQWSCQKIYAHLWNAGNSGKWSNVWSIFVGLDLKQ